LPSTWHECRNGRERAPEEYSDHEAIWGHRSAISTRKGGGFYGCRLHMAVDTDSGLREFGRLKHQWALAPLRVRGLDRVRLHADLKILAKPASALARARAVPLAA
jgi:hypothetical protein